MTLNKKRVTAIANAAQYVSETSRQERGGDAMFHSCNLRKLRKLHNFDYLTEGYRYVCRFYRRGASAFTAEQLHPWREQRTFRPAFREWTSISSEVDFSRRLAD